jgi:tetratricopeptide (TPR) repeat protein
VYQRLVLANVLRAQGRYEEAEAMYAETEAVVEATHFGLFQVWVVANRGWLYLLQGNYTAARSAFFQALGTTDKGQAASFNASLAVLYLLSGRLAEAEDLLRRSLHFYQTSGDELSIFALRVHLAYLYLQRGQTERAEEEIALGLGWAAQWNVDYFPHWWHPKIVATVCVHALATDLHPSLAERILVTRLGEAAIPLLHTLETASSPAVRRRVEDVLALLDVQPLAHITETNDEAVRQVLDELLSSGKLRQQKLPQLARLLSTTRQSDKANPVLLATFGLYVHGSTRREIAQRLHLSETSIRNYIGEIYERFGLEDANGSRRARYLYLRRLAVEAGYVAEMGN